MDKIENLRVQVSAFDASLRNLASEDAGERTEAIMDAAALLSAAKLVVLES